MFGPQRRLRRACAALAVLLVVLQPSVEAQLSKPVAHDSNMGDTSGNKYLQRDATADLHVAHGQQ